MSCPFRLLCPSGGTGEPEPAAAAAPPSSGGCPFIGRAASSAVETSAAANSVTCGSMCPACRADGPAAAAGESSGLDPATPSTSVGQCPFLAGMGGLALQQPAQPAVAPAPPAANTAATAVEQQGEAHGIAAGQQEAPAVCPLGFGGGEQGSKLGLLHCLLCKSLFHDCAVTSCGHRYCAGCIRAARDCPACGADIVALTSDPQTQALVERYIEAHAGSHTIWELEAPAGDAAQQQGPPGVEGLVGECGRASFLLQLGLRAIAAGNIGAARHRFQACQQDLERRLESAVQEQQQPGTEGGAAFAEVAAIHCRLGAVSGCLGDCCRSEGDMGGTLAHYQRSVELLQVAGPSSEAQQALSVALNKVGELRHIQGEVAAAAVLYGQALQLRRGLLATICQEQQHMQQLSQQERQAQPGTAQEASQWEETCCSAALALAASCIKLAGARRELGADGEAQELLGEAAKLLTGLEASLPRQPARLQRKYTSLVGFVKLMSHRA